MSVYIGGSAYAMVRDVSEGFVIITENTFKKFDSSDYTNFLFELDKVIREQRGIVVLADDIEGTKKKQRKLQRLTQALTIANASRLKWRK